MPESSVPTFTEIFKRNFKRVLVYWTQLTVILGFLGVGLGIFSLYAYTRAIGRTDLFMAAIDAKSALAIWLLLVLLLMVLYLAALTVTTWFYGLAVSLFEKVSDKHNQIACWLLLPIGIGFSSFILLIFFYSSRFGAGAALTIVCLTTLAVYVTLFTFRRFRRLFIDNTATLNQWQKTAFLVAHCFIICFTVVSAAVPTSLILNTYVGEETPEAVRFMALIALATLTLSLTPTFIFYNAKGHIYRRVACGLATGLMLLLVFLLISPGAMPSITYATAGNLDIRQKVIARFTLDDETRLDDLDNRQWRTRLHPTHKVEVCSGLLSPDTSIGGKSIP